MKPYEHMEDYEKRLSETLEAETKAIKAVIVSLRGLTDVGMERVLTYVLRITSSELKREARALDVQADLLETKERMAARVDDEDVAK